MKIYIYLCHHVTNETNIEHTHTSLVTMLSRLRELFTVTNFFTLICTSLTCFLLVQVVINFAVTQPTSTSEEWADLDLNTFPDVVVCVDPMFYKTDLESFGYQPRSYYRGGSLNETFIGWNGQDGKHNSTHILNKILTGGMLESFNVHFRDKIGKTKKGIGQFGMLLDPHGKCLLIKPPEEAMSFKTLHLDSTAVNKFHQGQFTLNVFLMDPVNSPLLFPIDFQMNGDHIQVPLRKSYSTFVIRTLRSYHVEGDPLFDCKEYNQVLS